ncbi:Hypothetical protein NTJ_10529 [Nesidiocoris tenuis]|uniref:Uncharacterized protein n=1 Tax=Nesidiocoris tenuis TaxID=355587 RepID=A0ABN7AZX2_9HEMI|nr:Hypothetical protein NTJ_10529 [Nesidiocoris tenuis]
MNLLGARAPIQASKQVECGGGSIVSRWEQGTFLRATTVGGGGDGSSVLDEFGTSCCRCASYASAGPFACLTGHAASASAPHMKCPSTTPPP